MAKEKDELGVDYALEEERSNEKERRRAKKSNSETRDKDRGKKERREKKPKAREIPLLGEVANSQSQIFQSKSLLINEAEVELARKEQEEISKWFPTPNVLLRWENVNRTLEIEVKKRLKKKIIYKQILFDVSGCVRPGEIMALMGPSGSGKTSLLNVLGGRSTIGVTGDITLNGEKLTKGMKRKIAYVMQQDIFFNHLTVREQLTYTALLRFPRGMSKENKTKQVNRIIETLGIGKCADSPIMIVSGGERKRVNIGTELLTNPTLLFLDEPTSGLDSTTSAQLMKTLRLLALQGRTILTSIHQPSSQVFFSFDKLLLLADGKTIFCDSPQNVLGYFANLGFQSPPNYNPADFVMDLVNAEENPRELLQKKYLEIGRQTLDLPAKESSPGISLAEMASVWPTSYFDQLLVLISRNTKNSKSQLFTFLNFIQSIALAVVVGLCWFQIKELDSTVSDRTGFIFFVMTFWPFQTMYSGLLAFPMERAVIQKERASGSYHLSAYFASKTISEAPIILLLPGMFLVISYWMANMNNNFGSFVGFVFAELACVWAAESIGLFMGAAVPDLTKGLVIMTVAMMTLMLVGGFFVRNLPVFVSWAKYLSIFSYAFNACLVMEFPPDRIISCSEDPVIPSCLSQSEITGSEILTFMGIEGVNRSYWFNLGMLLFLMITFRLLAYLSLRFLNTKYER